jgi:hypothetical protein
MINLPTKLPMVDLEDLGLLPEPLPNRAAKGNGQRREGRAPPAVTEDQREFERLMGLRAIRPRSVGQVEELVRCPAPDHDDRHGSCSVNWPAAVFNCHACGAHGGIGGLRRLLDEERRVRHALTRQSTQTPLPPTEAPSEDEPKRRRLTKVRRYNESERLTIERERARLIRGMNRSVTVPSANTSATSVTGRYRRSLAAFHSARSASDPAYWLTS